MNYNEVKMEIPKILLDLIKDGQIVLFLGSGASKGAIHEDNINPPTGNKLSKLLCDKFLDSEYYDRPLYQIAELAISEKDRKS